MGHTVRHTVCLTLLYIDGKEIPRKTADWDGLEQSTTAKVSRIRQRKTQGRIWQVSFGVVVLLKTSS